MCDDEDYTPVDKFMEMVETALAESPNDGWSMAMAHMNRCDGEIINRPYRQLKVTMEDGTRFLVMVEATR